MLNSYVIFCYCWNS